MAARSGSRSIPKHQQVFESLKTDIIAGRYQVGRKIPSEAALVIKFGVSRITVGRAIRDLQNAGLVERIAGSGTYVRDLSRDDRQPYLFGLLIPDLGETDIFEPICRGIANAPEASEHALLWGHADKQANKPEQAWSLCRQFIARHASGVFFAPLEFESDAEKVNRRILAALNKARIPVVLLDRRATSRPEKHRPDLVGLNNRQAAFIATEHLIKTGCNRIGFLAYHGGASTISERMAGYSDALAAHGLRPALDLHFEAGSQETLAWRGKVKPASLDAFVCLNDRLAGQMMHMFLARHVRIPQDMRLVGIDDVSYASLLPVPLTTVRQPTREIGEAALRAMLDRIRTPHLPPREVLLDGELIIRQSSGAESEG